MIGASVISAVFPVASTVAGPAGVVRVLVLAVLLLGTFAGAGLYLRGFWLYFQVVRWLHDPARLEVRRRCKSSAILAAIKEPELVEARKGLLLGMMGLPLFALAGITFNAMIR